jgi:hypothetical protein
MGFETGGDPELELWLWALSLWTLKEGASNGGPPDFRPRPRSKSSIALKGSSINNSPRPTTAKEKPAVLSRRA